jgi:SAM-dependent methyltransferase
MALYDALPRFYELEYEEFDEDLSLYLQAARRTGSPILDVGAGTGRVTIALARAGHDVVGIDESGPMLDYARRKLAAEPTASEHTRFQQVSVLDFDSDSRFRLAILSLTTFAHFLTQEQQLSVLHKTHTHLESGGLLIIDAANPDPLTLLQNDGSLTLHWERRDRSNGHWVQKWLSFRTDRRDQIQYYTLNYDDIGKDNIVRRTAVSMPLRYMHRYEAELLLRAEDFELENIYGSYHLDDYDADSERMILVARSIKRS